MEKISINENDLSQEYWKIAIDEMSNTLDRQIEVVETKRQNLFRFIKLHFVFIGFVVSIASLGLSGETAFPQWFFALICLPSLVAIFYSALGHRSLGSYQIGLGIGEYTDIDEEVESQTEKLKSLAIVYDTAIDRNRIHIDKHDKFRYISTVLLASGFGGLIAAIANIGM